MSWNLNPNASSFNPNASSFVPNSNWNQQPPGSQPQQGGYQQAGGGQFGQQGGYQQGGYQQGGHQPYGGYQQGGYHQGGGHFAGQQGRYQQQRHNNNQGGYQGGRGHFNQNRGQFHQAQQHPSPSQFNNPTAPKSNNNAAKDQLRPSRSPSPVNDDSPPPSDASPPPAQPHPAAPVAAAAPTKSPEKARTKPTTEDPAVLAEKEKRKAQLKAEQRAAKKLEQAKPVARKRDKNLKPIDELKVHDEREHMNIVFIGHVDAGKSTLSGQILLKTGQIDERTIEKFEREAKERNRESWWIAYIMDENEEEKAKGKTVEVGRAHFDTEKKRYTILDAPGHKLYVPNMIMGAQMADVGVLIISARKGEFESGFERQGQTREHSILAHTLGIQRIVVVVNKMDEQTVLWSKERYDDIVEKITKFLQKVGYKDKHLSFVPASAQKGLNISTKLENNEAPWYKGDCLLGTLDSLKKLKHPSFEPLRLPADVFEVGGKKTAVGKVESGKIYIGQFLSLMPEGTQSEVLGIKINEQEAELAMVGEQVQVQLKLVDPNVKGAYVICDELTPCPRVREFECVLSLQELLPHKPLMSAGYKAMIHVHNVAKECEVISIDNLVKDGKFSRKPPPFIKAGMTAVIKIKIPQYIPLETFDNLAAMGRFTLRDEGRTIGIGKVTATSKERFGKWVFEQVEKMKAKAAEKAAGKDKKKKKKKDKK